MKNRTAAAVLLIAALWPVAPTSPASAAEDCDTVACTPPGECREVVVEMFALQARVDKLEQRVERKNATIKRLRAQLAAQR